MFTLSPHPIASSIWTESLATYKAANPEHHDVLGHVVDLAREEFFRRGAGNEDHEDYPRQARIAARCIIGIDVRNWLIGVARRAA